MIIDFFDMLKDVFREFSSILSYFGSVKNIMGSIVSSISSTNITGPISPYIGTIRYVAGDTVYLTLARSLQIGMFILLARALYELVSMIINQLKAQKPISFLKTFLKI
ncbi:MAG: hypothetical protein QW745_07710 [Thermoplasmata archaeon]